MKIRDMNKRKGAWRRGTLELSVGGGLFLRDGNLRWRRRAVSDFNPLSPARSPSCRDCSFLPVVRYRSFCRNRPVSDRTQREKSHETEVRTTNRRFPPQPSAPRQRKRGLPRNRSSSCTRRRAAESRDDLASRLIGHPRYAFGSGVFI